MGMTVDRLLALACEYAEEYQRDFLAAQRGDMRTIKETQEFIEQLHAYRMKRWGKSRKEKMLDGLRPISIEEIAKRKTNSTFRVKNH